ncbi:MAG TPA: protease pro-enzyme activation domain-containing protein, partial [Mycobacteriales bacterium]|nr:protease pro-enzyme activation domain-containing protein [Mycobacteriales bacterium]
MRSARLALPCALAGLIVAGLGSPVAAFASGRPAPAPVPLSSAYARVSPAVHLPSGARRLGLVRADRPVSGAVVLRPRNPAELTAAAQAVSEPRSPGYHHYLAKGAFRARFGPTAATIAAVRTALSRSGLSVTSVSSNGLLVNFRGTASDAGRAFRTSISNVRLPDGRTGIDTTGPVSLPANIAGQVTSVIGLDTLVHATTNLEHATHPAAVKAKAPAAPAIPGAPSGCKGAKDAAADFGGLTDAQIAHSYGLASSYEAGDFGAGQHVGIYELEPFSTTDVATFDKCFFGATRATQMAKRLRTIDVDGGGGDGPGSGESILDIEDVSAMAPQATIDVWEAPNTTAGGMDELDQMVEDDTDQVITSSWGFCEIDEINLQPGYIDAENALFEQAALQGQTVLNSSGDSGSDECAYDSPTPVQPYLSQSDPASEPFVLGVGGTTIIDATNPPEEQVWNDGSTGGGSGGGPSSIWGAPSWQQPFITGTDKQLAEDAVTDGMTPCAQSPDGSLCREAPDVSAQADEYTGAITIYTKAFGGWTTEGGTSSSAPLWAGMLAVINASAACQAAGPIGFVDPSLYAIAAIPAEYKASFNDIKSGDNDVFDLNGGATFRALTGYDMATGLGSPRVRGLTANLCTMKAPSTPPPVVSGVSPEAVGPTTTGSLTVTGSGFTGAQALSIDAYAVPSADWTVNSDTQITVSPIPTALQVGTASGLGTSSADGSDGTGRAVVTVTGSGGATSAVNADATMLYVDGTSAAPVPSVGGISAYGGAKAGGNTVTVFGSGFASSAPDPITSVTVGGVPALGWTVKTPSLLEVTIPPYQSGTTQCAAGDDPTTDICQAQLVVTNANGSSQVATIEPPYEGAEYGGVSGETSLPDCVTGHTCEIVAAVTEYDYFPKPTITSVTTTDATDPTTWASENGTTLAFVNGTGFDYLGLEYANIGSPSVANNQDFSIIQTDGATQFEIALNPSHRTHEAVTKALTVQTLAGRSSGWPIRYAGVPRISKITPNAGPDTGGTHVTMTGTGFDGVAVADGGELSFGYLPFNSSTVQLSGYTVASDTKITGKTPGNNPGAFAAQACTLTGCSVATSKKSLHDTLFDFYQRGTPRVTSLSVKAGPASGGTRVVIHGHNLADAVLVTFGKRVAEASNAPQILTNGSSTEVDALAPPGKAGTTVNVRVTTVESRVTHHGPSAPSAGGRFRYHASIASAPRHVRAKSHL